MRAAAHLYSVYFEHGEALFREYGSVEAVAQMFSPEQLRLGTYMKGFGGIRIMLVCSWILFELAVLSGYTSVIVGTPSAVNFVPSAVVFGIALIAFHAEGQRWISGLAAALNGLVALVGCALVIFGINFWYGVGAFVAGGAFLIVFCGPALLNVVALLPTARGRNASEPVRSASG